MRSKQLAILLAALTILSAMSIMITPAMATYPNDNEDWDISTDESRVSEVKVINGLNIQAGGSLVLEDYNLTVENTITIASGSRLIMRNSTLLIKENITCSGTFLLDNVDVYMNRTINETSVFHFITSSTDFVTIKDSYFGSVVVDKYYDIKIEEDRSRPSQLYLQDSEFRHLGASNHSIFGMDIWNSSGAVIDGITISEVGSEYHYGLDTYYHGGALSLLDCKDVTVQNCHFNGSHSVYALLEIKCVYGGTESNDMILQNNEIFGGFRGIYLYGGFFSYDPVFINDTRIEGNDIKDNVLGVYVYGKAQRTLLEDNNIHNCTYYGFWVMGYWFEVPPYPRYYVYNNTFHNMHGSAIYTLYKSDTVIRGNDIYNNGYEGIMVDLTNNTHSNFLIAYGNTTIENNRIINNNVGIFLFGKNAYIAGNEISNNVQDGIYARAPVTSAGDYIFPINPEIRDNVISNNGRNGIFCNAAYTNHYQSAVVPPRGDFGSNPIFVVGQKENITNNLITGNGQDGVNVQASPAVLVQNTITGNTRSQVAVNESATPTLIDNTLGSPDYYFIDSSSKIFESWVMNISVEDQSSNPVDGVTVTIKNAQDTETGANVTGASGQLGPYTLPEKTITDSNGDHTNEVTTNTPYNVSGAKDGHRTGYADVALTQNRDVTLVVPANGIPGAVSAITPTTTHDLTPTISWTAATDPDGDGISYTLNIGTTAGGTDIIDNTTGGINGTTFDVADGLLNYGTGSNDYHITIWSDDGWVGGIARATGTLTVTNTAPSKPTASISPANPADDSDIVCSLESGGVDSDTDPDDTLTYKFEWSKNGVLQPSFTQEGSDDESTLGSDFTTMGDVWSCVLTAYDGFVWSDPSDEVSVTITNKPPVANTTHSVFTSGVTVDEDDTTEINLRELFSDPDGPFDAITFTFTHAGTGDGNVKITRSAGSDTAKISPDDDWHGQETYTINATSGGTSVEQDFTITVTPVNDAPELDKVGGKPIQNKQVILRGSDAAVEREEYTVEITGYDVDVELGESDTLTFSANDTAFELEGGGANVTLKFTPTADDVKAGTVFVNITLTSTNTEGGGSSELSDWVHIQLDVKNSPDPPFLVKVNGKTVTEGETVSLKGTDGAVEDQVFYLNVSADDPDFEVASERLSYSLGGDAGAISSFIKIDTSEDTRSVSWRFEPDQDDVGMKDITVTVTDSKDEEASVDIQLEIINVNDPPEPTDFEGSQIPGSMDVEFSATPTTDEDPDSTLTCIWDFDDGEEKEGAALWNVTHTYEEGGEYNVTLTITDGEDEFVTFFVVSVTDVTGGGGDDDDDTDDDTTPDVDEDGDGLDDNWEIGYWGDITSQDGEGDPDDDGFTNLEEYKKDTDPTDAGSKPKEDDSDGDGFPWWIIILIIVIIVIVVLLLVMMRKKDDVPEEPPMEEEMPMEEGMDPQGPIQGEQATQDTYYDQPPVEEYPDQYPESMPEGGDDLYGDMPAEEPVAEDDFFAGGGEGEGPDDSSSTEEPDPFAGDAEPKADEGDDSDDLFGEI